LIKEKPFQYKPSEDLIVVSLGTGGTLFKNYSDGLQEKIDVLVKAATECRTTAEDMHKQYNGNGKVKYVRFDPDAVGRYDMDDAAALSDIQNEMANWFNGAQYDKLEALAKSLTDAMTETSQVHIEHSSSVDNSSVMIDLDLM
jgi:hypothetical protein